MEVRRPSSNLKAQIDRMPTRNGAFVLCIPKKPYRCPPGPYERACVVADILKRVKGGGKLIISMLIRPSAYTD